MNPKVSVITPSFNQGAYLEETIQSVLNQTYKNIEYIIIDGGSTDNSIDIIKKYDDKIAYWVSEKDNGQADAINKGFKKANGEFICWINSDDILYPSFVEKRISQFATRPNVDFIYGDIEQGASLQEKFLRKGKKTSFVEMLTTLCVPIPQQSAMWRSSILETVGYLSTKWYVLLDREFFMRIAQQTSIEYIPDVCAFFRNHVQSKSVAAWLKWADELEIYYQQLFHDEVFYDKYGNYYSVSMAAMYVECAKICEESNAQERARFYKNEARKYDKRYYFKKAFLRTIVRLKNVVTFIK